MSTLRARILPFALALASGCLAVGIGGCAKMDAALGQQWIVVTFAPNTTVATARHIVSVCTKIPNIKLQGKIQPTSAEPGVVGTLNFTDTYATLAQQARLQECLQRFPTWVQGLNQMDSGGSG